MPRTSIFVDRGKLESAFRQAEANGPLENRSKLFEAVAAIYNKTKAADAKELTASVVYLRFGEYKLTVKTPLGKKGRTKMTPEQIAHMQAGRGKRVPKGEKFATNPEYKLALEKMLADVPERFKPVALKVIQGSRGAAVKLKCLECSCWQPVEIRLCPVVDCALWCFRPYQGKSDEIIEGGETEADDADDAESEE